MSILGTPVNFAATPTQALTWTLETGTTAVIIVVEHEQTALSELIDGVSLGSVAATFFGSNTAGGSGSARPLVEVWRITADLNSIGTNPTITITPDAAGSGDYYGTIYCVDGIDTNTANWTGAEDSDTAANAMQITLTTVADSLVIGGATCTASGNSFATTVGGVDVETTGSDRNIGSVSRVVSFSRVATGSSVVVDCDNASSSGTIYQAMYAVSIPPAASGPTISSVDSTPEHLASEAFTGTGFPTSQTGSAAVKFVGAIETVTLTPTYNTATALSAAFDVGNNKFGVAATVTVTDSSGNVSSGYAVTPQARAGGAFVNLSTLAAAAFRLESAPDLQSGYQIEYYGGVGCTCGSDLIVFDDATVQYPDGATGFYARAHNGTSWGAPAFITIASLLTNRRGLVRELARPLVRPLAWDVFN